MFPHSLLQIISNFRKLKIIVLAFIEKCLLQSNYVIEKIDTKKKGNSLRIKVCGQRMRVKIRKITVSGFVEGRFFFSFLSYYLSDISDRLSEFYGFIFSYLLYVSNRIV